MFASLLSVWIIDRHQRHIHTTMGRNATHTSQKQRTPPVQGRCIRLFVVRFSLHYDCELMMLLNHLSVEKPSLELNTDSRGAGGHGTSKKPIHTQSNEIAIEHW